MVRIVRLLGYCWTAFATLGAAIMFSRGDQVGAIFYVVTGLATFPPIWRYVGTLFSRQTSSHVATVASVSGPWTSEVSVPEKPQGLEPEKRLLAWVFVVLMASFAFLALSFGRYASLLLFVGVTALLSPPIWKMVSARIPMSATVRFGAGIAMFALGVVFLRPSATSLPTAPSSGADGVVSQVVAVQTPGRDPREARLAILTKKLQADAVQPNAQSDLPKMVAKIGKSQFDKSNALMRWAGLAAAESDRCPGVDLVEVSDKSSTQKVVWFVDCSNGERFMITEDQAAAMQIKFDPTAPAEARAAAEKVVVAKPKSQRWQGFDETLAASKCDMLTQEAMINRRSFDPGWRWDTYKDEDSGHVTLERDFRADAALGPINSRYQCVVDADHGGIVIGLSIREVGGWRKLL